MVGVEKQHVARGGKENHFRSGGNKYCFRTPENGAGLLEPAVLGSAVSTAFFSPEGPLRGASVAHCSLLKVTGLILPHPLCPSYCW
jgi:hypothetical protein